MPLIPQYTHTHTHSCPATTSFAFEFHCNDIEDYSTLGKSCHPDTIIFLTKGASTPCTEGCSDDGSSCSSLTTIATVTNFLPSPSRSSPKPIPCPLPLPSERDCNSRYEDEKEYYTSLTWEMYKRIVNARQRSRARRSNATCPLQSLSNANDGQWTYNMDQNREDRVDDCHTSILEGGLKRDYTCRALERSDDILPEQSLLHEEIFHLEL